MVKIITNNKDKIHLTSDMVLVVNGKEYIPSRLKYKKIDGIEHTDRTTFQEFNRKEIKKKISFIVDKIKKTVSKEELLKELLQKQALSEIDKLYNVLQPTKSKKPKKITKQEGCIGIKIGSGKPKTGGRYFQLIE